MARYSPKPGSAGASGSNSSNDPFSFLSSAPPSNAGSRSLTPANPLRSSAPANQNGLDAFSSLLGPSFPSSKNQENLSLAARRAAAQKQHEAKIVQDHEAKRNDHAAWSGLDILGHKSSNTTPSPSGAKESSYTIDEDWLSSHIKSESSSSSNPAASSTPSNAIDDWEDLLGAPNQNQGSNKKQNNAHSLQSASLIDSLDSEDFIPETLGKTTSVIAAPDQNEELDDDILGALGKPVGASKYSPSPQSTSPTLVREQDTKDRTGSPPPHIIGQIVEMGFSPQQARLALASTDSGLDIQQALETLLTNGVGVVREPETVLDRPRRGLADFQDEESGWEEHERQRDSPRTQRPAQRRTSPPTAPNRAQKQPQGLIGDDMQERADRLLAQASEIGLSVFNRANALWKDGKEKVQKAYEERAARPKPVNDGRPRWMAEIPADAEGRVASGSASGEHVVSDGFRDRDHDDIGDQYSSPHTRQKDTRPERPTIEQTPQTAATKTVDLFDEPAVYVSPARRRPAASRSTTQPTPSPAGTPRPVPPKRQSTPPLLIRQTVSASTPEIASSNAQKEKGTELYKLGQYANAEQAYTAAMAVLPANHLLLVPLHNNRAQTRIKIGEHSGAIEDCTTVLSIIGLDYHPAREAKVAREEEGAAVDLAGGLLKAFRRRAEAHEGREKWELALRDWEAIIACEWSAKLRNDAFTSASRCRKMLSPDRDSPSRDTPAPRPVPHPAVSRNQQEFEAVKKFRQANEALDQEEQTKANLKDSVDARLSSWKGGKETNIRALIASLETVLWPELSWQKVGLHELVTPSQVKVRYMKAIAKLHPDKIDSSNTTVEQRMIANGVFAALNDAWTAFKQ